MGTGRSLGKVVSVCRVDVMLVGGCCDSRSVSMLGEAWVMLTSHVFGVSAARCVGS